VKLLVGIAVFETGGEIRSAHAPYSNQFGPAKHGKVS
jgi:hypothetical protein